MGKTVLGLHRNPWHDTGACVLREQNGGLQVVAISEERLDRVKHSRAFPSKAIRYCLKGVGLQSVEEVDLVVCDYICVPEWGRDLPPERAHELLGDDVEAELDSGDLPIDPAKVRVVNHHLCHAAASFYSSGFLEAAVLVIDGRGSDKETQTLFAGGRNGLERLASTDRLGMGLMYATVTQLAGFGLLQEGKTMGLSAYGDTSAEPTLLPQPQVREGIVTDYENWCVGRYDTTLGFEPQTWADREQLAAEAQHLVERDMLHLADWSHRLTAARSLCLGGGVALNSVGNWRVAREGPFERLFVFPACSDSGIPMGAALYGYYELLGGHVRWRLEDAYLGRTYGAAEIEAAIGRSEGFTRTSGPVIPRVVELLAAGKVVAWFDGASEYGPRALGHRSILVDPRTAENRDRLNDRVKFREPFRPFAPIVPEERAAEYFDLDRPAPYMLLVPKVLPDKRDVLPAVTHVDGSGRVQTVAQRANPRMHELLHAFEEVSGVPVLLNTSFNVAGEPIVESPDDAIRCVAGTEIDALAFPGELLVK